MKDWKMKLTRESTVVQIKGLELSLRYLRDALMHTYMDIPVEHFILLRGNLPYHKEERMPFLLRYLYLIDFQLFKDIKSHIFNTNDKDLAEKFCGIDLIVWQLLVLCTRFKDIHEGIGQISDKAGEFLQMVFFLKKEMLKKDFFDFDCYETFEMVSMLEKVASEKAKTKSPAGQYAGWSHLEEAVKKCNEQNIEASGENIFAKAFIKGEFLMRSYVDSQKIQDIYRFLQDFKISAGRDYGKGIIDADQLSLQEFESAIRTGCFEKFIGHVRMNKFKFFICHFSDAYIADSQSYREIVAASMQTTRKNLESYDKDPEFAKGLHELLPLLKYNNT